MKNSQENFFESSTTEQRSRDRKLRGFVAGAALIVVLAIAFMTVQKGLFKRSSELYFFADSAKGMAPGMAVKLNGFKIGTLNKLVMDIGGRVSAVLLVGDEYLHLIHKDAKARWTKEDLIGEGTIDILPGSENSPTIENNAVIAFDRARDISDELGKLAIQLQPILADVKNITAYVDNPDGELKTTLRQLKRATTALASAGEDVSDITRNNKKQIHTALTSATSTLNNLDNALPPLIKQLNTSLQNIEGATADAHKITGKLVTDVPVAVSAVQAAIGDGRDLMSEGSETLNDTHQMINAVKESWPIRNLLPPQEEHSLPMDSHVPPTR